MKEDRIYFKEAAEVCTLNLHVQQNKQTHASISRELFISQLTFSKNILVKIPC
jgi:hypothetical protein